MLTTLGDAGILFHNYAIVGSQISGMVTRATSTPNYNSRYDPNRKCFLLSLCGINNFFAGQSAASAYAEYAAYCTTQKNLGFKMIAFTLSSVDPSLVTDPDAPAAYSALIRANYATFADALVDLDLDSSVGGLTNYSNPTYFIDGVHMTTAGWAKIASLAITAVTSLL